MGSGKSPIRSGSGYKSFDDSPKIKTTVVGRVEFDGKVLREGHTVEYSMEYNGDGRNVDSFFSDNSNVDNLISGMSDKEKADFRRWAKGAFMNGQQYDGFSNMSQKDQNTTRTLDKYLDQSVLSNGVQVVRLSDAQLVLGKGNSTPTLEALQAAEGNLITSKGSMSFSAAKTGLKVNMLSNVNVEYKLSIPGGTKGAGMYIGNKSINKWGNKQREFVSNRDTAYRVGKTSFDSARNVYVVELSYEGRMEHDYS